MYWDNFNIFYNNLQKILLKNSFIYIFLIGQKNMQSLFEVLMLDHFVLFASTYLSPLSMYISYEH